MATAAPSEPASGERTSRSRRPAPATIAAVAVVLAWFAVALGRYVGDPPDLDAMVALREALVVKRDGFGALIDGAAAGVHPPLLDLVSVGALTVFGEDPRSLAVIAVALFAVLAAGTERLLAGWLSPVERVLGALAVAICPALAITTFLVTREALMLAVIVPALVLALRPGGRWRWWALGLLLAVLPLVKENGLVVMGPFALYALATGGPAWRDRLRRAAIVGVPAVLSAGVWRLGLSAAGGEPWESWLLTPNADDGSYAVALRAMLALEDGLFMRQNLANALVVNWLWLPSALALVTVALGLRRSAPPPLRAAIGLVAGLALVYAWTTLGFPTYTIPRYAAPVILCTVLLSLLGLALWPRRARPFVLGALLLAFLLGASGPTDPVSRALFGTTTVAGQEIYDTDQVQRGPDRMMINLALLEATEDLNDRLRRVFASPATVVTGDCFTLKAGEKLFSIGQAPEAYDRALPGARPLACVAPEELPPGALDGPPGTVAVLRTPEEVAAGIPMPVDGPAVLEVR